MVTWLVPVCLFWTMTALYLGGFRLDIEDKSGMRNLGGLVVTFVLYLLVWWGIHGALARGLPAIGAEVAASVIVILLLPLLSRAGFRAFGVGIRNAR